MPTPRDSTDDLPLQLEPTTHTSCPPESSDRNEAWREETLSQIQHVFADVAGIVTPTRRLESSQPDGENLALTETCNERRHDGMMDRVPCNGLTDQSPPPMASSPQSSSEEEREPEEVYMAGMTSSALELSFSTRYGIGSPRVCQCSSRISLPIVNISPANTAPLLLQAPSRKQVPRQANVRSAAIQRRS